MSDNCPNGDNCGVHYRVNSHNQEDGYEILTHIDYVGQHAVVTTDSPQAAQALLMAEILGLEFVVDPVLFETCIIHVGDETIYNAMTAHYSKYGMSMKAESAAKLWSQGYDEYRDAISGHSMTVDAFKAGIIELNRPEDRQGDA